MEYPQFVLRVNGREVWSLWDPTAETYELFAEPECKTFVGCADTIHEARSIASDWLMEA
jgi:hypothetical protein